MMVCVMGSSTPLFKINGKPIPCTDGFSATDRTIGGSTSILSSKIYMEQGDTLTLNSASNNIASVTWCAYPIIVDESGSGGEGESGSCFGGYEIYDATENFISCSTE